MKKLALATALLGLLGLLATADTAVAADKNDPTGTWKIKTKFGEKEVERTLKLENKDGTVTGTISGFGKDAKDTKIEDGKFKDGELTFAVTTERKGNKNTTKYSAKIDGDTIKGTATGTFGEKEFKSEFEGKKEK